MFGSNSRLVTGGALPPTVEGSEVNEIPTDKLGFTSLDEKGANVRLLPNPWPSDKLPRPTSQLFSVASKAGLVAAADPNTLYIGSTESLRNAFKQEGSFENRIKPYEPQLKIPIGTRLSHVIFSSDDEYLILCAESGGGLQVHKVSALKDGHTQHAFQAGTGGIDVRAVQPNPVDGRILAVVLGDGKLILAEINAQGTTAELKPLRASGVSCVSWSARGKQLVAGLEDGTIVQLQRDGNLVVQIQKPPQLPQPAHVGSIAWLDNDNFFVVYNPNDFNPNEAVESASFMLWRVNKNNESFEFRKFPFEPTPAFGMKRSPPHHFIQRIRDYEPALKDMVIVSNTCSEDIGIVARYAAQLSADFPNVVDTYSSLQLEETRRPVMPNSADNMDEPSTSPIGSAIDLSSTSPVRRPLPKEEDLEATAPLPALMVLNNEGLLSAWWLIHQSAILQKSPYKHLIVNRNEMSNQQPQQASPLAAQKATPQLGAMGQAAPAFGQPSMPSQPVFGQPAKPAFGQPSFGQPSGPAAFGQPSALGGQAKPTFGATSSLGLGNNAKPFGSFASAASNSSPFGNIGQQNGATNASESSFASSAKTTSTASPFSNLSKDSSAPSLFGNTQNQESGKSLFGNTANASPFGAQNKDGGSLFNRKGTPPDSPFAAIGKLGQTQPSFGSTVTLGSTLGTNNSFGGVSSLGGKSPFATPALSNQPSEVAKQGSAGDDSDMNMGGLSGLGIGDRGDREETPKPEARPEPLKAEDAPLPPDPFAAKVKQEPVEDAPLPPDPVSTKVEEAPLPPDPSPTKNGEDAPLPSDPSVKQPKAEPAPLPPSPEQPSSTPFDTPEKKEEKHLLKFPPPQQNKPSSPSPLGKPPTPPVDFSQEDSGPSPVGSEPEDLGNDSAYVDSPTRSQLPGSEDTTQTGGLNTWPRSPRGKPPIPANFRQQSPPPKPITESNTPLFSPDAKATSIQTPFSSKPFFQPPQKAQAESPRSPSPSRDQQIAGRRTAQPRKPSGSPSRSSSRSPERPPSMSWSNIRPMPVQNSVGALQVVPSPSLRGAQNGHRQENQVPEPAQSTQKQKTEDLEVDQGEEDEEARTRAILSEPINATRQLGEFQAHSDYVGHIKSTGLSSQIERVYRDIDSMIDTLGWNSRTMASFIQGHVEQTKESSERDVDDLQKPSDWALEELENLKNVVGSLFSRLHQGRLQDVRTKQTQSRSYLRMAANLSRLSTSIERQLAEIQAAQESSVRSTPRARLTAEQSSSLSSLRLNHMRVQETIRTAEEAAAVLRAKLVAANAAKDVPGGGQMPTVEAVMNTIAKMTRMAETKRGDVDLLESQIRRIRRDRRLRDSVGPRDADDLSLATLSIHGDGSPVGRASVSRRQGTPSSPLSGRKSASATPTRHQRAGSYAVPSDTEDSLDGDDYGNDPARTDAETAHLRAQLRRQRERLARARPAAALAFDDAQDRRVDRLRRARVLDVLRAAVVERHEAEVRAIEGPPSSGQHDA